MWSLALCTLYAGTFGSIAEVVIRVQRKPWIVLTISMLNLSIGTGLSIWWVLGLNWGITGALGAGLATQIVNAIAYSIYLQPYIKPATFSKTSSNKLLQYALPYIPHRIQAQVMQTCALFLVNQHLGLAATGIYAMVGKFVKPLNMLVDATQRAWVPYKFHVHKTSAQPREIFRRLIGNYWLLLLLIWGIACFIFPFLFKMLVSPRYFSGISYFPFLAFIPLVQAFYYTVTVGVEINKNQRILPISSFWGMFATVILGLSSAPFWSPYGPILALISGYLVIAYVVYLVTSKLFPVKFYLKSMALLLGLEIVLLAGFYADIISLSVTLILLLINIVWFIRVFMLVNDKNIELPYPKIRH
jgi:O-antigen/teichoic acid export membrane protein